MVEELTRQQDFLFRGDLEATDPDVAELIRHETARQARTLIMIPSESTIPEAVREAISGAFHNIYAEGYPPENMRHMDEADILDYNHRLSEYRRNADNRYYKGTEYANMLESLARRRVAEVYANGHVSADQLYVNVQPLSGAPANNAVYTALLRPGDTVMSMDLMLGGHLSHGAPVNRTGKTYNIISYGLNADERIDYNRMMELALQHRPKILIGGYSSYPLKPNWAEYRNIADAVGAILLADVAHVSGMIAAGVYPSPVGIADIVTFTTHKTLGGPRGAVIITHRKDLSSKLDRGVFPGEQGGPHVNSMAGLAVAMRLAKTEQFRALQQQTVDNAARLAERLQARGLHVPHGGTETHLLLVDCKRITGPDGTTLSGDMAARILDLAGVVCNRQTIPGDTSALRPNGIRLGTPWITQRGCGFAEIDELADIIADVLLACVPFSYTGKNGARAKIDFDTLHNARLAVRDLTERIGIDTDVIADGYPHFAYIDDAYGTDGWQTLAINGEKARDFLQMVVTSDVLALHGKNRQQVTNVLEADGRVMTTGVLEYVDGTGYLLHIEGNTARVATWLRSLSDGFVIVDPTDAYAKIPGPVDVAYIGATNSAALNARDGDGYSVKPYFVGMNGANFVSKRGTDKALPEFTWDEAQQDALKTTVLHGLHNELGAKMAEFAGYEMPLWYDKVLSEHLAVRRHAGLFDVTHMGVWDVRGAAAEAFLDALLANDVRRLQVGRSHYTFLLDVDGVPFDDLLLYRLAQDHFFVVVNASNDDKNWAWVQAVREGRVMIDRDQPTRLLLADPNSVEIRDLRADSAGDERRVDIALQGPQSRDILLGLGGSDADLNAVRKLPWSGITRATLGGYDLIVTRTGYTGERIAYEVFPHPDHAAALFNDLLAAGAVPCGLAARDSLRIEAGLPLYGHELAGPLNMNPADADMDSFVKLHKPFFVGKAAFIDHKSKRDAKVVRFRLDNKGARPAHQGDPIVDKRGRVVGIVTSCSMDGDGYQLGQAYVKLDFAKKDTALAVFAGSARAKNRDLSTLALGDKTPMPEPLTVLSRFPRRR